MPKVYNKHHGDYPDGSVYIGRGSNYGNPYIINTHGNRTEVIAMYKEAFCKTKEQKEKIRHDLFGKDLVCFCKPKDCHGDILLEIANNIEEEKNGNNNT